VTSSFHLSFFTLYLRYVKKEKTRSFQDKFLYTCEKRHILFTCIHLSLLETSTSHVKAHDENTRSFHKYAWVSLRNRNSHTYAHDEDTCSFHMHTRVSLRDSYLTYIRTRWKYRFYSHVYTGLSFTYAGQFSMVFLSFFLSSWSLVTYGGLFSHTFQRSQRPPF